MKRRAPTDGGRKRPADAELILVQVKDEFTKKKQQLGARKAAEEIDVSLASFYNYAKGKTLPDLDVLRKANAKWGIKWKHIDFSEIMQKQNVRSEKQLGLIFLDAVHEKDIEVVKVRREGTNLLQVALKIRFST